MVDGDRDRVPHQSSKLRSKVQLKSTGRQNMTKKVRTMRGWFTHRDRVPDLMGEHKIQLDQD